MGFRCFSANPLAILFLPAHCILAAYVLQRYCKRVAVSLHISCSATAYRFAVVLQQLCSGTAKGLQNLAVRSR